MAESDTCRRLFWLSDANSAHTERWVRELAARGHRILLFSLTAPVRDVLGNVPGLELETAGISPDLAYSADGNARKLAYLGWVARLRRLARSFRPDVVHAHYVSSYGVISSMAGLRPRVVSVWGADVYNTPGRSFLHRRVIGWALNSADLVLSTSWTMRSHALGLCRRPIEVVPFGVDIARFAPSDAVRKTNDCITIGTVKALEDKYGIEYLVRAFAMVCDRLPALNLRLLIVGGGSRKAAIERLVADLGLGAITEIRGAVPYSDVHRMYQSLDVAVFPSVEDSESFGVAVVEAQACECPVIVSRVGGLPEVVEESRTGLVIPARDAAALAVAIEMLVVERNQAVAMGKAGRRRVLSLYDLKVCVRELEGHYSTIIDYRSKGSGADVDPVQDGRER